MGLPNFLIIGAPKSGTSALYAYLRQHPQVFTSGTKEPGFFAFEGMPPKQAGPGSRVAEAHRIRRLSDYERLFREAGGATAVGEASTVYMYSERAPLRIRHYVPRVKLVALLRNPVDRAYSGYRYTVRDGFEPLASFEAALKAEPERISAGWQSIWHHTRLGFYAAQLRRYYEIFDRDQIRVYIYDDFLARPTQVLGDLCRFLGVDEDFQADMSVRHNISGTPRWRMLHGFLAHPNPVKDAMKPFVPETLRSRVRRWRAVVMERNIVAAGPGMSDATRRELISLFSPDVLELQGLIDQDLSAWLSMKPTGSSSRPDQASSDSPVGIT